MRIAAAALSVALLFGCSSRTDLVDSMPDQHQLPVTPMGPASPPCTTHNVHKDPVGLTLVNPKVHLIFWGDWRSSATSAQLEELTRTWGDVLNNVLFWGAAQEYGIGLGRLTDITSSNTSLSSATVSDFYIRQEIDSEIAAGVLADPDANSIYVVVLPNGTHAQADVQNHFGGYHGYSTLTDPAVVYSVVEYSSSNTDINVTLSHEVMESSTDPDTNTGYKDGPGETEIGDFCNNTYTLDGNIITKVWSQVYCKCVP